MGALLALLVLEIWIVNAYVIVIGRKAVFREAEALPAVEAIVIPGASVYRSGELSPALRQRVEAGIRLHEVRPEAVLLLSGYAVPQGYNEVQAMAEYARRRGVPAERLLLDEGGRSTYVTLLRCRKRFRFDRIAVVSQRYHLPRSVYIAKGLGMEAFGFEAGHEPAGAGFHGREILSRVKDFFLLRFFPLLEG